MKELFKKDVNIVTICASFLSAFRLVPLRSHNSVYSGEIVRSLTVFGCQLSSGCFLTFSNCIVLNDL